MPKIKYPNKEKEIPSPTERRAWRVPEFALAYRVSVSTVYKLIAQEKLRTVFVGGRRLIPVEAADELFRSDETASNARGRRAG